MQVWKIRTIFIIILGLLGTLALCLRPAFCPDSTAPELSIHLPADTTVTDSGNLRFHYTWDLKNSPAHTVTVGDPAHCALAHLTSASWELSVDVSGTAITISSPALSYSSASALNQISIERHADILRDPSPIRQPNGALHRYIYLWLATEITVTPSFWGTPSTTILYQTIRLDVQDGCADLIAPDIPISVRHLPRRESSATVPTGLPERYCGTPTEREILTILYTLADTTSPELAEKNAHLLTHKIRSLINSAHNPQLPWPDSWENAATTVQTSASRLGPTLSYLKENHYFHSKQLESLVHSSDFATLFGNTIEEKLPLLDGKIPPIRFIDESNL